MIPSQYYSRANIVLEICPKPNIWPHLSKYLQKELAMVNTVIMVLFVLVPIAVIVITNSYILG